MGIENISCDYIGDLDANTKKNNTAQIVKKCKKFWKCKKGSDEWFKLRES